MESIQFVSVSPSELTEIITSKMSELIGHEVEKALQKHLNVKSEKEFITRMEAAEMLSLSYSGLYKLIKKVNIKVYKVGKKPYYKKQDIIDILEQKFSI